MNVIANGDHSAVKIVKRIPFVSMYMAGSSSITKGRFTFINPFNPPNIFGYLLNALLFFLFNKQKYLFLTQLPRALKPQKGKMSKTRETKLEFFAAFE